jgi:hypothetical protein
MEAVACVFMMRSFSWDLALEYRGERLGGPMNSR